MARWAAVLGLLVVAGLVLVVVQRPWAIAAVREGVPSATWPASGSHTSQSLDADPLPRSDSGRLPDGLAALIDAADTHAFVVVRDGEVVVEHYGDGFGLDTMFNSFSMSKGLVGALTVQALSDGRIASTETTVGELWPGAAGTELLTTTVAELLDMRSGLSFEYPPGTYDAREPASKKSQVASFSPVSDLARLHVQGLEAVMHDVDLVDGDRGRFSYQQLNTAILGRVLEELHGRPLDAIVRTEIAEPSGAGSFHWRRHGDDERVSAYCCLYATADWWASVGWFLSENGTVDQPFVTPDWHAHLLGHDLDDEARRTGAYRSQLWHDVLDREGERLQGPFTYFAGLGGQVTYLVPEHDLVVVRFGDGAQLLHSTLYEVSALG